MTTPIRLRSVRRPASALRRLLTALVLPLLCALLLLGAPRPAEACTTGGCASIGPRLASISSTRGVLLNALLGNLAGTTLSLDVLDWNAVANGDISLLRLVNGLQTQLGVSSPTTALTTQATLGQLLAAAATAATGENQTLLATSIGQLQNQLALVSGSIRLGNLLVTDGGLGDTRINVLELVTGLVQLYNTNNVVTTPSAIALSGSSLGLSGILNTVRLSAQIVEPPVYVCGPVGSSFHSAAIRVKLDLDLVGLTLDNTSLLSLLGITSATVQVAQLGLYVEVARANGVIAAVDALAGTMSVQATPGIADLYLGQISDAVFFNRSRTLVPATDLTPGVIGSVKVNNIPVGLTARAWARGQAPSSTLLTFGAGAYPQVATAYTQAGFSANLLSTLVGGLQIGLSPSLGGLLDGLVLLPIKLLVQGALSPLLGTLSSGLIDPLLGLVGVRLGEVDVQAGGAYKACSVAGLVYEDKNHSARREIGETGIGSTLYAKLVPAGQSGGAALAVAAVDPTSGAYAFNGVNVGSYTVVFNTSSAGSALTAALPAGFIATEGTTSRALTLSNDVSGVVLGLYRGSRLAGRVFLDTGRGSGTPHNGVRDGTETGLTGMTVVLTSGSTEIDRAASGDQGSYVLWIPSTAAGALKLAPVAGGDRIVISGAVGSTGGSFAAAGAATTFTAAAGQLYDGADFGLVPTSRFDTDGQQTVLPGSVAFYAHRYTAGSAGQLTLDTVQTAQPGWSVVLYEDLDCNGRLDAGEAVLTSARTVTPDQVLCVVAKVASPATATFDSRYPLQVRARLAYTGLALVAEAIRQDLTTIGDPGDAGLKLTKAVDRTQATIGDTLTYTIGYANQAPAAIANLKIADQTPAYTVFVSAACDAVPSNAPGLVCSVSLQPAALATGRVEWSFAGSLPSGAQGSVRLVVRLQ